MSCCCLARFLEPRRMRIWTVCGVDGVGGFWLASLLLLLLLSLVLRARRGGIKRGLEVERRKLVGVVEGGLWRRKVLLRSMVLASMLCFALSCLGGCKGTLSFYLCSSNCSRFFFPFWFSLHSLIGPVCIHGEFKYGGAK